MNSQDREKYKLENPRSYHYLNQSDYYELDGVNDAHEYLATRRAMDIVGIIEEEQVCSCVFPLGANVLCFHVGFFNINWIFTGGHF